MKDQKEALHNHRKPDITHCRRSFKVYAARACEYGEAKGYERANYLRPAGESLGDDFKRLRAYLRAGISHFEAVLDSLEHHQANDPRLEDVEGMRAAAFAPDTDTDGRFPASLLPHLCGGSASIVMAIEQAVTCGLLPEDPGQPWTRYSVVEHAPTPTDERAEDNRPDGPPGPADAGAGGSPCPAWLECRNPDCHNPRRLGYTCCQSCLHDEWGAR
jgi:hypothetical protein